MFFLLNVVIVLVNEKVWTLLMRGVNNETRTLLGYWGFHAKNIDDAWYLLEWIAWDSFEFEKAAIILKYSFPDPCAFYYRSYYARFWCYLCNSSGHETNLCPYYICYDQFTLHHLWTIPMLSSRYLIHHFL